MRVCDSGRFFIVDLRKKNNARLSALPITILSYGDEIYCNEHSFDELMRSRFNRRETVVNEFVLSLH